ncbi:hypothetical protein GGE65_008337 [Skermanella aerolata]|uniref:hypothetical protein n=1 Tax=Skermanella aerolata TaxID=393310 RepID=UPI003D1EC461
MGENIEPAEMQDVQPVDFTGKTAEYLEKQMGDSFKREQDQEENVIRSLPFFATSIGVLVTFVTLVRKDLPVFDWTLWPGVIYGLLAGVLVFLLLVLKFLHQAVRRRDFVYLMSETKMLEYARATKTYYQTISGHDSPTAISPGDEADPVTVIENAVVGDLRNAVINDLAAAAQSSRSNNLERLTARTRAFTSLMIALIFALAMIVAILIHDTVNGGLDGGQDGNANRGVTEPQRTGPENGPLPAETNATGNAGGREGGLELQGSDRQKGDPARTE